ncbi:MAG: pYEATS domain-containing protein [Pseudomonadota bacterium]
MADIFINYRRKDTAWSAGRIGDRLRDAIGGDAVFQDTITIEPGVDFVEAIGDHVEACRVLLSLIGPRWIDLLQSRLAESNDFVRIEIEQALARGIRVIPIIVDDTKIPSAKDLPPHLESFSRLNAVRIEADSFEADMSHFVSFLKGFLNRDLDSSVQTRSEPTPASSPHLTSSPQLSLAHRTEFWKNGKDGRPRYRIFVSVDASSEVIRRISKVIYRLHPTFKNPTREVIDARNNFELRTNGWGEFEIEAIIHFTDASEPISLRHWIHFN